MKTAKTVFVAGLVFVMVGACVGAQNVITEVDVTAGHSTEDVRAAATQVRVFGEGPKRWRLFAEGTWADVWGPTSDAFGSAYPYNNQLRPMEVFAEKTVTRPRFLVAIVRPSASTTAATTGTPGSPDSRDARRAQRPSPDP